MTYTLFYSSGSAAMSVRIALEEIRAPYTIVEVPIGKEEPRSPDHLRLNPNGWVPVLAWGDHAMYEAAAILIYLSDRHPEARLGPSPDHPTRPLFLQTLTFLSNTVQTAFQQHYYPERFCLDAGQTDGRVRAARRLHEVWQVVEDQIGNAPWTIGETFSVVDAHIYTLTTWFADDAGHPTFEDLPNVGRIARQVTQRESVTNTAGL